ncbi:hypothetical protein DM01DRAFT_1213270 [Hesseltinella vesiculosa]|uniref:Uncharacterized protein n=1 Tax=Hesseltinella vesiculosa TaxID=101127 RepID=A0A1X2G2E9_9FUNG|nr:hypothetical protein DM01DRAFT_1213270 [Hesseltinella vesiculosa]
MVNPMADYYTKYYICVVSALWATTFSLFILFLPLLHNFFQEKRRDHQKWNRSQQQSLHQTSSGHSQHLSHHLHLPRTHGQVPGATIEVTPATLASLGPASHPSLSTSTTSGHASTALTPSSGLSHHQGLAHLHHKPPVDPEDHDHDHELLNLEEILGSSVPIIRPHPDAASCLDPHDQASSHQSLSPHHFLYEGDMPVRKVFRYLPWLAPWQMVHLMAFPGLGYITTMSKLGAQGYAMAYDHATIHCNLGDTFILKIRGRGYWDMLIQVPSWKHLERWHQRLNHTSGSAITTSSISSSHEEPLPAAEAISLTPKSRLIP